MAPGAERVRGAYRVVKTLYNDLQNWLHMTSHENPLKDIFNSNSLCDCPYYYISNYITVKKKFLIL